MRRVKRESVRVCTGKKENGDILCLITHDPVVKDSDGLLEDAHALIDLSLGNVEWRHETDRVVACGDNQQSTFTGQSHEGRGVDPELDSEDHTLGTNLLDQW